MPSWALIMVGAAAVRTVVALSLYLSEGPLAPSRQPLPLWAYVAFAATFTLLGLALVAGNRRDARAAWLGGVYVIAGSPLVGPLLRVVQDDSARWLLNIKPEAFVGLFLWSFVALFPARLAPERAFYMRVAQTIAAVVGIGCAAANLATVWLSPAELPAWLLPLLEPSRPGLYWPLTFGVAIPSFPVMLWRARTATEADRRRVRRFVRGLVIGTAPFAVEVLVEQLVPPYRRFAHLPSVEPWFGAVLFGAFATVPFLTAYSVLFDRVVEVRLVLRTALQYALARYTVIAFTMVPFGALVVLLIRHLDEPMAALLVRGPRTTLLGAFVMLGLVTLRARVRWLELVDRRYFREAYSADQILTQVMGELSQSTPAELCRRLSVEIDRALHADVELFLVDDTRAMLTNVGERMPPLALDSTLAQLAAADIQPMDIDLANTGSPLRKLRPAEQQWLTRGNFRLLVALRGSGGEPDGLLALTAKRSGLEYSEADRRLLSALASAAGLALQTVRLRRGLETPAELPARECRDCSRLADFNDERCGHCGGTLVLAAVPHRIRGMFLLERRIGAGGMGVVYKATDLELHRPVAIKALPRATPDHMARLRREARAMAAVSHPNLAVIYGIETWQDVPLIVQEYVAGGTLAERIAGSPLSVAETLDLGITLAGCLEYLHASGMVHCDIKPSNIGFAASGVVKLLDFGLVRLVLDTQGVPDAAVAAGAAAAPADTSGEETVGPFGTPAYMSPEAWRGERPTPMFDLWALVVVLFECVSGKRPFDPRDVMNRAAGERLLDIRQLYPGLSAELARFFEDALSEDPGRRPRDAATFAKHLRTLQGHSG